MPHRSVSVCLFILLMLALGAGRVHGQTPQKTPPKPSEPTKEQPPPLSPRHRRGLYTNNQNIELIDASPQSPPLEVDDPGVPDKGEYEINLTTDADLSRGQDKLNLFFVDANFGFLPKVGDHELPLQLKVEVPFSGAKTASEPFAYGLGGATVGLKWNFYNNEHNGLSLSIYPQLEFAASASASKGLVEPGQTLLLPLLLSKPLSFATLVVNGGLEQPFHDPDRKTIARFGVGLGRALMRKFAVMSEIHGETRFDFNTQRAIVWNVGVMYGVRHLPVYARIGRSLYSDDGHGSHTYLAFGVKLMSQPMHGGK